MNIFILDYNPVRAAKMQCDKHVVKMPLETAQLLCSVFEAGSAPYKRTHYNHPCSIWTRQSSDNFKWLVSHGLALCDEYTYRYGKDHKSRQVILWCMENIGRINFPQKHRTRFVMCFEDTYKVGNAVESYRLFYKKVKARIAQWNKSRKAPGWYYN